MVRKKMNYNPDQEDLTWDEDFHGYQKHRNEMPPVEQPVKRSRQRSQRNRESLVSPATKFKLVVIAAFLLMASLLGMCVLNYDSGGYSMMNNPQVEERTPETVVDLFVDLNGDGKIDYLKQGEVIFNYGP